SAKLRPRQEPFDLGKNGDDPLSRRVFRGQDACDPLLPLSHVLVEVRAHELVFAAERVVEGSLGDACLLNDSVDSDDVHALRIKQFVCSGQQALSGGTALGRFHGMLSPLRLLYRPFCLSPTVERSLPSPFESKPTGIHTKRRPPAAGCPPRSLFHLPPPFLCCSPRRRARLRPFTSSTRGSGASRQRR